MAALMERGVICLVRLHGNRRGRHAFHEVEERARARADVRDHLAARRMRPEQLELVRLVVVGQLEVFLESVALVEVLPVGAVAIIVVEVAHQRRQVACAAVTAFRDLVVGLRPLAERAHADGALVKHLQPG